MAFHLAKFLAHISPAALEAHLRARLPDMAERIDWSVGAKALRRTVVAAIQEAGPERPEIYERLERAHQLCDEVGDLAMLKVGAALVTGSGLAASRQERALLLLDRDERLFTRAEEVRNSDSMINSPRYWSGYRGPLRRWPDLDPECLERFRERLRKAFATFDGSGATIEIESFERAAANTGRHGSAKVFHLAVYLEALPQVLTEFTDAGLDRRGTRPASEVVLTYSPDTGSIDVTSRSGRPQREQVAKAFVEELLATDADIEPVVLRSFDLSPLYTDRELTVEAEDGIRSACLVMVRFDLGGGPLDRLTLERDGNNKSSLHEKAREWFSTRDPFKWAPAIVKARIKIRFLPRTNPGRDKILAVEIGVPNSCNLRDRTEYEHLIGEKYLERWGLLAKV